MLGRKGIGIGVSKVFVAVSLICGSFLSQSCEAKLWDRIKARFGSKKREMMKRTERLNETLGAYRGPSHYCNEGFMQLPEADVLIKSLERRDEGYTVEKHKVRECIRRWAGGKRVNLEVGVPLVVSYILCAFEETFEKNHPHLDLIRFGNSLKHPKFVDFFRNRLWDLDPVEEEIKDYLDYVSEEPKTVLKERPTITYSHDLMQVPATCENRRAHREKLKKCLLNNSKEDCIGAFSYVSDFTLNDPDKEFLREADEL